MNKKKTLLIMAAGMGSRYGGLKQMEPMGPNGEFMIDYSIYDAKQAGFTKVVFIIKQENYKVFKETIGKRVEPHIKTEYVFQDNKFVPDEYLKDIENRTKPLGTGYAILCAKDKIKEPFAVINADDFYGRDAFQKASKILEELKEEQKPYQYAMIGYLVKNTMTENGSVKRGICKVENHYLKSITECSVETKENKIIATSLYNQNIFEVKEDDIVSMNLALFTPSFFPYLEKQFKLFLEKNKNDLKTCEFFMPDVIFSAITEQYATVKVLKTTATWYGVTYKEDTPLVRKSLQEMIEKGQYKKNLWS